MRRATLYSIAAVLAVAALFFFMTTARAKVQCRVCIEFRGRTNCATALGPTEQAAREGAQSTACGPSRAAWMSRSAVPEHRPRQFNVSRADPRRYYVTRQRREAASRRDVKTHVVS